MVSLEIIYQFHKCDTVAKDRYLSKTKQIGFIDHSQPIEQDVYSRYKNIKVSKASFRKNTKTYELHFDIS